MLISVVDDHFCLRDKLCCLLLIHFQVGGRNLNVRCYSKKGIQQDEQPTDDGTLHEGCRQCNAQAVRAMEHDGEPLIPSMGD